MIPNVRPRFQMVNKHDIIVPRKGTVPDSEAYQRLLEGQSCVVSEYIRRNFAWPLFGAIICCRRKNGTLVAVDGGTRLTTVMSIDSIDAVPTLQYDVESIQEEAEIFLALNKWRATVMMHAVHWGQLIAGDPIALHLQALFDETSRVPARYAKENTVSCVASLRRAVAKDIEAASDIYRICAEICKGETLPKPLFEALFFIETRIREHRPHDLQEFHVRIMNKSRLALVNGIDAASATARRFGGNRTLFWAEAAIAVLNEGEEHKLSIARPAHRPRLVKKQKRGRVVEIRSQIGRRKNVA